MKQLVKFLYESGLLKNVKRSGWSLLGIPSPESVADHSYRTAVIGYFLAKMEGANPHKITTMCVFHDIQETRLGDLHKVGRRYLSFKEIERNVLKDQISFDRELFSQMEECQKRESKEAKIVRDADLLENILQAREYINVGYKDAQNWIENAKKLLTTDSAKKLVMEIENISPNEWWDGLKKID